MDVAFLLFCLVLVFLAALAFLPWLLFIDVEIRRRMVIFFTGNVGRLLMQRDAFKINRDQIFKGWKSLGISLAAILGVGTVWAFYLDFNSDHVVLGAWGRFYMSLVHLLLAGDLLVLVFFFMLWLWPKGGAVALAAFREGLRQPMFWLLAGFASLLMLVSPFIPYFTFGEDLKMVKELCFAFTMLAALFFGVVSSCISVHEEIEGRTAVTVMSKPISRRQFLLGKFFGILLSALAMTMLMGWVLVWVILLKEVWDPPIGQRLPDPQWVTYVVQETFEPGSSADLLRGIVMWIYDSAAVLPMLILGFCQVMVLIATAVALATRLPMVVNLTFCLIIYFLGHLTPIMTEVTKSQYALVYFVAQLFETILPGLDLFDVGSAIIRDMPPPPVQYSLYTLNVALYALTYTAIALLFGLILFEDRDLA